MFNISNYLEKISKIVVSDSKQKKDIQISIEEVLKINIKADSIFIKNNFVLLKVSPSIKNLIFIKKKSLLEKFSERGIKNILDIS